MTMVLTQKLELLECEVVKRINRLEKKATIQVENMVYYPYYFFEFDVSIMPIVRFKGKTGCTVDALDGKCALVDVFPELIQFEVAASYKPDIVVLEDEAKKAAMDFIYENALREVKFLKTPNINLVSTTLYYSPFWLIRLTKNREQSLIIVDAISGSYHPL